MDVRELAWASGLFDGEGCITITSRRGTACRYPMLHLAMTDEDAVRRFHAALGGLGNIRLRPINRAGTFEHRLPLFVWNADSFEAAQAVITMLWYGLNGRRRARATEVLNAVRASQVNRKYGRRGDACSFADCDRPILAREVCSKHYQRRRYKEARERVA